MRNEYFLRKAEELKPALFREEIVLDGEGKPMEDGEEVIYDFGSHYTGYLRIDFGYEGHHPDAPLTFSVQFAEIREELDLDPEEYHGWISRSWIQKETVHLDVVPSVCQLNRRYAFRYVRIGILHASGNYRPVIRKLYLTAVTSADSRNVPAVQFTGDDLVLDRISQRTLSNCMQDVFEDGPKRDRRLWLGDLRLQALANYQTFRNNDLVKRCLYLFAGSTLDEGRLASNVFLEPQVECDDQTMFDYTLFFINTLWDYYRESGDRETLNDLYPVCMRQYELLKNCFDTTGMIDTEKAGRIFADWNFELDKQASGQAVWIYAVRDLIRICKECGEDTAELEIDLKMKTAAAMRLYDEKTGMFVSGPEQQISWASQIWMILAEVPDRDLSEKILRRLPEIKDAVQLNSPYAYHHYIQALINTGMKDEAYTAMHEYWGGMAALGADTFWELYNPEQPYVSPYGGLIVNSFCHAWSCTPTYFLRKYYAEKEPGN